MMNDPIDINFIWDCLRSIIDPEIGVNIVDLGMIYGIETKKADNKKFIIDVTITFTTPTCPMMEVIVSEIKSVLMCIELCEKVNVTVTFDPPWTQDMITEFGKMELGTL